MPHLRQLVIAAEDPARLSVFYQDVFELDKIDETKGAVFLSDGTFNLALVAESDPAKRGLRRFNFETVRVESLGRKLAHVDMPSSALAAVESRTGVEFELPDPDGNTVGICRRAFDVAYETRPAPIRHSALYTPNPRRLAEFYCRVFDMKEVEKSDRSSIFLSDGYFNLALLHQRKEEPLGLNHFGFHVKSNEETQRRAKRAGAGAFAPRPQRILFAEYRTHDPEGNGIDISQKGWPE